MERKWYAFSSDNKLTWYIVIGVAGILVGLLLGRIFSAPGRSGMKAVNLDQASRVTWIDMAADGYALNGDEELARQRLEVLTSTSFSWKQLGAEIEQAAAGRQALGDETGAQQLRQLSAALNLPAETTPEESPAAQRRVELWRVFLFIFAVLAFLALVALGLWLMARQTLNKQAAAERVISDETVLEQPETSEAQTDVAFDAAPSHALSGTAAVQYASQPFEQIEEIESEPLRVSPRQQFQAPDPHLAVSETDDIRDTGVVSDEAEGYDVLGTYEAEYSFGTDDFDCSFTISLPDGTFMGDCGVGVSDVLPAIGPQHVDALEVWLFDKGDVSSVSKYLVSEYAYEDPTLNNRLSAKGDLVMAEPGAVITLETRSLRVTAQVLVVEYDTNIDPNKSYFRRVVLELVAEVAD